MCRRGEGEKQQKNRGERQTDGQRDRGQRTEVQSAQVGMKNGFRRRRRRRRVASPALCPEYTLKK